MRRLVVAAGLAVIVLGIHIQGTNPQSFKNPTKTKSPPLIREQQTIKVGDVKERWQLEWVRTPDSACAPEDGYDVWATCACAGFAFGEHGELHLTRLRPGAPEERLNLTPFFKETPKAGAVLRRWPVLQDDRTRAMQESDKVKILEFGRRVRSRSPVTIMRFANYDHDAHATEFVLQVGAGPCGHQQSVLVGISLHHPHLHVFGTAEHPDRPLVLESPSDWEGLLRSPKEVILLEYSCGDHVAEQETEVHLRADALGIHATRYVYECESDSRRGRLISKEIL